jgi:hypothetical protein
MIKWIIKKLEKADKIDIFFLGLYMGWCSMLGAMALKATLRIYGVIE